MFRKVKAAVAVMSLSLAACTSAPAIKENNQQKQETRHPSCLIGERFVSDLQGQLEQAGIDAVAKLVHCDSLQPPHDSLGLSFFEVVIQMPDGSVRHMVAMMKFATDGTEWHLLSQPDVIIDFTQEAQ